MWRSELMLRNVPHPDGEKYRAAGASRTTDVWLGERPNDATRPLLKPVAPVVTLNFDVDLRDAVCKENIAREWLKKKLEAPYVDMGESAPQGLCHMLVESTGEPKTDSIQLPHQDFGVMYGTKMVRLHPSINSGVGALFDYDTGTGKSIVMARIIYELTHESTDPSKCSECVVFWPDTKDKFKDELTKVMHSNDLSKGLLGTKWIQVAKGDQELMTVPSTLHAEILKSTRPKVSIDPSKLGTLTFTIDSVVSIQGRYYKPKASSQYRSAKVPNLSDSRDVFRWAQDIRQLANSNENIVEFYKLCRTAYAKCVNVKFPSSRAARPYVILIDEAQFYLENPPEDVADAVAATLDAEIANRTQFDAGMEQITSKASCLKHFMKKLQEAGYKTFLYLFSATVNMGRETDPMFANLKDLPFDSVPGNKFAGKAFHTLTYSEMAATLRPYVKMEEMSKPETMANRIFPNSRCVILIGEGYEAELEALLRGSGFVNKTQEIRSRLDAINRDPDTELHNLRAFLLKTKREDEVTYAFATEANLLGPTVDVYGKSGRRYPPTPINIIILGKKCDGVSLGNTTLGFYFHPPTDAGDFKQKASRAIRLCSIDPEEHPLPTFKLNVILNDERRKRIYGEWTPDDLTVCITQRLRAMQTPLDMLLYKDRDISKPLGPNILPEFVGNTETFVASAPLLEFKTTHNPQVCVGFYGKKLYKCVMDKSRRFAVQSQLHRDEFRLRKITFDFDGEIAAPPFPTLKQPAKERVGMLHKDRQTALFQQRRFKQFNDYFTNKRGRYYYFRSQANGVFARKVWVLSEWNYFGYTKEWLLTDFTLNHPFDFGDGFDPDNSVVWIGSEKNDGGFKTYDFHGVIKYSSELQQDALFTLPTFTVPDQRDFPVLHEGMACEVGYQTNAVYLNYGTPEENGWYMIEWMTDSDKRKLEGIEMSLKTEYLQAKYPSIPDLRVVPNSTVLKSMAFKSCQLVRRSGDRAVYNLVFHQPTTTTGQPTVVTRYGVAGQIVRHPDESATQLAFDVEGYANNRKLFVLISEDTDDEFFQFNNVVYPLQKVTRTQHVYYSTSEPDDEDAIILQGSHDMTTDLYGFFYLSDEDVDADIQLFDERSITLFAAEPVDRLEECRIPWTYHFHRYVRMYMKQTLMKNVLPLSHVQNVLETRTACLDMFLRHSGKKYIPKHLSKPNGGSSLDLVDFETRMLQDGQKFKSMVVPRLFTEDTHDDLITSQLMRMLLLAGGYSYANLNEDFVATLESRPDLIYDNFMTVRRQQNTMKQTLAEITTVEADNPLDIKEAEYIAAFNLDTKVAVLKRINLVIKAHLGADNHLLLHIFHESAFRFMIVPLQATRTMRPTSEFYNNAFNLSLRPQPGMLIPSEVSASVLSKDAYEPSRPVTIVHPISFTQDQTTQLYDLRYYVVNRISSALLSGEFGTKESIRLGDNAPKQCTLRGQYSSIRYILNTRVKSLQLICDKKEEISFLQLKDLPPLKQEFTTPYELGMLFVALIAQLAACDVSDLWLLDNHPDLKTFFCTRLYNIASELSKPNKASCMEVASMFAPPNVDLDALDRLYTAVSKNRYGKDCRRMLIVALRHLTSLFDKPKAEDYVHELYNDMGIRQDLKLFQTFVDKRLKVMRGRTFTTVKDVELPNAVEANDIDMTARVDSSPTAKALRKRKAGASTAGASTSSASTSSAPAPSRKRNVPSGTTEDGRPKRQSTGVSQKDDVDMASPGSR